MKHKQIISRPGNKPSWSFVGIISDPDDDDSDIPGANDFLDQLVKEEDDDDDRGYYYDGFEDEDSDFNLDDDDSDVGATKRTKSLLVLGYVCGVVAPLLKSVSAGCAQALNGTVPHMQLSLMRYAAQMLLVTPFICARKLTLFPGRKEMLWLVIAAILNNTNNATYYGACAFLPVGIAGGTMATFSVLGATLVTLIASGKIKLHSAVAVIICIAGVVLLVQPGFLFHELLPSPNVTTYSLCGEEATSVQVEPGSLLNISPNETMNITMPSPRITQRQEKLSKELTGFILLLVSSVASVSVTVIMRYKLSDCNPFVSVLWFGACGVIVSALVLPVSATPAFPKSSTCIVFMLSHSCAASVSAIFAMVAMMLIAPLPFYLLHSLEMLFLAFAQYTVLSHLKPGHRNAVEVVGMSLVFISSLMGPGYSGFKQWNNEQKAAVEEKEKQKKKKRMGF